MVERFVNARFLCHGRWRCLRCDSPWFASTTCQKAIRRLERHLRTCGK